jgi:aminotransferase
LEAITGSQVQVGRMVEAYQRRRDLLVDGLNRIPGVRCLSPQGAFYAFPDIRAFGRSSADIAGLLLESGVAVLPGTAFGAQGEGFLRLVFANSVETLERALERMPVVLGPLRRC